MAAIQIYVNILTVLMVIVPLVAIVYTFKKTVPSQTSSQKISQLATVLGEDTRQAVRH